MNPMRKEAVLFAGVMALLASAISSADVLEGERVPIEAEDMSELARIVLGRDRPVWQFKGDKWVDEGKVIDKRATVIYRPFRSSVSFCRAYGTTIHSPGWVCDGSSCPDSPLSTYDIKTRAFLAEAAGDEDISCADLDFESDYFALEDDLHDSQVDELIAYFRESLEDWRNSEDEGEDGLNRKQVSARDIASLEILPRRDVVLARFLLRHPESEASRLVFELEMDDHEVIDYSVYEMMP